MKQKVCANCGQSAIGKVVKHPNVEAGSDICLICDSTEFREVVLPDEVTCVYCKKRSKTEDVLKIWKDIPFLNINDATYYCGCRGWE